MTFKVKDGLRVGEIIVIDPSGNVLTNAATATQLQNSVTLTLSGDASATTLTTFANATNLAVTLANVATPGSYTKVTIDSKGRVLSGANPNTVAGYGIVDAVDLSSTQTISGTKTFTNITVTGTVNFGNAVTSLTTQDAFATVGSSNTGSLLYLGLKAERGATDAYLAWDEANTRWGSFTSSNGVTFAAADIEGRVLISTAAIGTAPFIVASNTVVTNLNADLLDGHDGSYFSDAGNLTGTLSSSRLADIITPNTYTKLTVSSKGLVTGGANLTSGDVIGYLGYTPANVAGFTATGAIVLVQGTTSVTPLKFTQGTLNTSAVSGALEYDGTNLYFTDSTPTRHVLAFTTSSTTGSAAKLTTARNFTGAGAVTWSATPFDGSADVTFTTSIAAGAVGSTQLGAGAAVSNIGYTPLGGSNLTAGSTFTFAAGTTTAPPFRFQSGVLLTTPTSHTAEWDGSNLYLTTGTALRKTVAYTDSNITGSSGSLATSRNFSGTGDVTFPAVGFDGTGNVIFSTTIATGAVTSTKLAAGVAVANLGYTPLDKAGGTNSTATGTITLVAGSTTVAPMKFQAGSVLTTPVAHALEWDGSTLYATQATGPTRKTIAYTDSALTGNTSGSAAKWTTARTVSFATGDVSGSFSIDGSANVSNIVLTIGTATVTTPKLAAQAVTTATIADANVTTAKLAAQAVTTATIADANVTTAKLAAQAVTTATIADGNVTTVKIADNSLTTPKYVAQSVTTAVIADNSLTTPKYVAQSVTTSVIADLNVTTIKIADNSLTTSKYVAQSVTTAAIADNSISTPKYIAQSVTTSVIADSNVTTAKMAAQSVTTTVLADLNVTAAKIADGNVTTAKIADGNVTTIKLADANVTAAKLGAGAALSNLGYTPANKAGDTFSGAVLLTSGTAAAPAIGFSADIANGLYRPAANTIGFSMGGSIRFQANTTSVDSATNGSFRFVYAAASTTQPTLIPNNLAPASGIGAISNSISFIVAGSEIARVTPTGLTVPTQSQADNSTNAASTAYVDTGLATKLNLSGGTMTGTLILVADPVNALDAATKQYVDNNAQGIVAHQPAIAATTANITISNPGTAVFDGITLSSGDRLLVKNQTTTTQNGIYVFNGSSSALTRTTDFDTWPEARQAFVFVQQGSTQANTGWVSQTTTTGTIGTDPITWAQFSGAGTYTAGVGLTLSGTQFALTGQALAFHNLASFGLVALTSAGTVTARTLTGPSSGLTVTNGSGVSGNPTLALANDLAAIEGLAGTGIAVRTASDTWAQRTISITGNGLSISNGDGVAGNPTISVANDLAALEALGSTGYAVRTGTETWAQRSILMVGNGISIANTAGIAGDTTFTLANDLAAVEALASTGYAARTGVDTWAQRSIVMSGSGISIANPAGIAGDTTLSLVNDLGAVEALSGTGYAVRTGTDTWAQRNIVMVGNGISIANTTGVAGDTTFTLANDLAAIEALASTGFAVRTANDTWAQRIITVTGSGLSITNGTGVAGDVALAAANDLAALEGLASTGIAVRTGTDAWTQRSVAVSGSGISISNGDGVAGNPTVSLATGLANLSGVSWSAGTQVPSLTAANTWSLLTVGSATGNLLNKAAGDGLYLSLGGGTLTGGVQLGASTGTIAYGKWTLGDASNHLPMLEFYKKDTTRAGYIGYGTVANTIEFAAENGYAFTFINTSPTAPTPTAGDNSANVATTAFVQSALTNSSSTNYTVVSSNITLSPGSWYLVDTTAARTLTLPALSGVAVGKTIRISDENYQCGVNNITLNANGTDQILSGPFNANSYTIDINGTDLWVTATSAGWRIVVMTIATSANGPGSNHQWVVISSNITLIVGEQYLVDTTAARTLTLPALSSVATGNAIRIGDLNGQAATHNITINAAGADVFTTGGNSTTVSTNNADINIVATAAGWKVL